MNSFVLQGTRAIGWPRLADCPAGLKPSQVISGRDEGDLALEVALAEWSGHGSPAREAMLRLHKSRLGGGIHPVVVVAYEQDRAWLFGPNQQAAIVGPLDRDHASRLLQSALEEPTGLAARHRLVRLYDAVEATASSGTRSDALRGISNSGLFATHELRLGVRARPDWQEACTTSEPMLALRSESLIRKLGYTPEAIGSNAILLKANGVKSRAVAVMLKEQESFDGASVRFAVSPVAFGLKVAEQREVSWLMVLRGSQLRLYPAKLNLGVGRKGLSETYFEVDLAVADASTAGFLQLVFSADALADGGSCGQILASSSQYAVALGHRLREKVYGEVVPRLSLAIADALRELGIDLDRMGLDQAYQITLRIFFRLLFQAYAEDRKLLPYGENPIYDRHALKTLAKDLAANPDQDFDSESTSMWDGLAQVWHVIDKGDKSWAVPAYNGGLFSTDPELQPEGALIERVHVANDVMGPVLRAMLVDSDPTDGTTGCIDFRSLSVREFGTIYEGLLESNLGLADTDLVLDEDDNWVPAKKGQKLDPVRSAKKGTVYFHDTSGARKGTGSYFTQSFVVEHLLEQALDPALDIHLARVADLLAKGDQAGAADLFFDFRVGDLAMGSAHFLTAAIDHIEQKMAGALDTNPIPGVTNELLRLESAAIAAAGEDAPPPEKSSLLRRQIARRCIYGLDINPVAVELARVSIWIHTFVRGLPMSSLDHNLVCANSLTGIGSVDEALDALVPSRKGTTTLFDKPIKDALNKARHTILSVSSRSEVDRKESHEVARAAKKAHKEAEIAKLLFDAAVLRRIGRTELVDAYAPADIAELAAQDEAQGVLVPLQPGHMPVLFPEVFLRANGGFDVLVGNPPWEKLHVEEHQWWGLRLPGLRSLPMTKRTAQIKALMRSRPDLVSEYEQDVATADRARQVLAAGPYPGIGSGHIDLYKAFAWRNWQLLSNQGVSGVVLPRGALNGSGTEQWRRDVLGKGTFRSVCFLTNSGGWVFESVHPQYTVALAVLQRGELSGAVRFCGPFHSRAQFESQRARMAEVGIQEFDGWTATAAFPLLPTRTTAEVFRIMQGHPRFKHDEPFAFRAVQGDLNAASNKELFNTDLDRARGTIPVLTGGSISIWNPDYGPPYAKAGHEAEDFVLAKVLASSSKTRSAFFGIKLRGAKDLPMHRPRIAFRDICRPTDSRTCIPCLVPPGVLLVHAAPYLVLRKGTESDEAYLLGVLSSIPFDWYVRRIVELHLTFELLDYMPIPRPPQADRLRKRVCDIAGRLSARDTRFKSWAKAVGVPVGTVKSEAEQEDLEAELDACVARLYGLTEDAVTHIFETFHRGWDHSPRLARVLRHFSRI
jgi:hypothetical protein